MAILSSPTYDLAVGALGVAIIAFAASTVYSVYFGPLAKFPGPKLAAATRLYEFYYDLILKGRYTWKIRELHQEYGPIIRISPYELHIDEPDYYDELYSLQKPRNKYEWLVTPFGLPGSGFSTIDHKLHRIRRSAIAPFFSKASVKRLEPMLSYMVQKLCKRIDEYRDSGQVMPIRQLYMCLTTDVITLYALNHSWGHLDSPDLSPMWVETIVSVTKLGGVVRWFPWIQTLSDSLPLEWVRSMDPGMGLLLDYRLKVQEETQKVIDGTFKQSQEQVDLGMDKTVIHALLESDLPPAEKLHGRVWQEAQIVIGAGADTTANALNVTHFHVLDNPEVHRRLKEELEAAIPNKFAPVELNVVEKLPYLSAVIQEGLRLSYGVSTRLQRIHPTEVMKFHDWEIPPGTPVGMTAVLVHENETIFPEPMEFKPERWLEKRPDGAPPLDRYLVAFGKGSRQCLGMNLAKADLYLTLATVFRRYEDQELFESSRLDVDAEHDYFLPQPSEESKGVKVLFK